MVIDYGYYTMVSEMVCKRCGHCWITRRGRPPVQCPDCRSPYWNKERVNAKTSSGSAAAVESSKDARVSISELRSIAAGVRENLDRSIQVSVSTAKPVEEEERVMCPYTEYDSETGETYGCRLPEHSVKIKHQRGSAL